MVFFIILIISLVLYTIVIVIHYFVKPNDIDRIDICCLIIFGIIIGIIITTWDLSKTPTAMDVYRGKTELEITSINGVPQDTIVVWKK